MEEMWPVLGCGDSCCINCCWENRGAKRTRGDGGGGNNGVKMVNVRQIALLEMRKGQRSEVNASAPKRRQIRGGGREDNDDSNHFSIH